MQPLGPVFQVNTYTINEQELPDVASDATGNFVIAWESLLQDGHFDGIFARRFDAMGAPRGPEFQVNTYTTGDQRRRAAVASDAAGNFTIAWSSAPVLNTNAKVMGQRYDASGNRRGSEFQVNTATSGYQYQPAAASDVSGNVVVVWQSKSDVGPLEAFYVAGRRFDPAGAPVGGEFRVDTVTAVPMTPDVAIHAAGGFVVAWKSREGVGVGLNRKGLYVRSFDATGAGGEEVQANSCFYPVGPSAAVRPRVISLGTGGFAVAWAYETPGPHKVQAQVFSQGGFLAGPEVTVADAASPAVGLVADGPDRFVVLWNSGTALMGRSFNAAGVATSAPFPVAPGTQAVGAAASVGRGRFVTVWQGSVAPEFDGVFGRIMGGVGSELEPRSLGLDTGGNRVLEAGEPASFVPEWRNPTSAPIALSGTITGFTGPTGATYTIVDANAQYGVIGPGQSGDCVAAADCYAVSVSAGTRPADHWDAAVDETLSTGTRRARLVHLGDSFGDVPRARADYRFVESLLHQGVIAGCAPGLYCPDGPISRQEMAVYLRVAREGAAACGPIACNPGAPRTFADVPQLHSYCPWIEELARFRVTAGCGGGNFCPSSSVTREQMAVFVLVAREGPAYAPVPCLAGAEMFADVPASSPFCRYIEELARRNVVTGCGGGNYCPAAAVTRGQMAVFVAVTFALPLYGP